MRLHSEGVVILKMNRSTQVYIELIVFSLVFLLAATILKEEYLFGWAIHNWTFSLVLCLVPLFLILINKRMVSTFMSIGIVGGLFIGNYLGDYLRTLNVAKITPEMSNQEIANLHLNHGFVIWIAIIIGFVIVALIAEFLVRKKIQDSAKD